MDKRVSGVGRGDGKEETEEGQRAKKSCRRDSKVGTGGRRKKKSGRREKKKALGVISRVRRGGEN